MMVRRWISNMIDTHIYDYDTYSRDTEMSTYLCAESVMNDIDEYLRDRFNLALDDESMVYPRLLDANLHLAAENKVLRIVLSNFNWVDVDTKSIRGANVEAVRCLVGPQVFDDFFRTDTLHLNSMDSEAAVQLLSPFESVKYCAHLDEPYYPKAFSKLMLKSTVDTLCDLYKSGRYGFDVLSSAFGYLADHMQDVIELGLLNSDNSAKLNAYLSECLSPRRSFKLSESRTEHTDSPLLLDNVADVELQGPNFCGYNITFERDWYKCDREAAMAMRQLCDSKDKETETTVSRKTLHVPEVAEDDKDLEY